MTERVETASWFAALALLAALYAVGASGAAAGAFGVNALGGVAVAWPALLVGAAVAGGLALGATVRAPERPGGRLRSRATAALVALAAGPVFWVARTTWLNPDGLRYGDKFRADVPVYGAHVTHDEMLELYVHSRFWDRTHAWWGWTVEHSYQVLSCAAGVVFIYVMARLAPRLAPRAPWLLLAGALAGGYLQLFFGDVENYTITAALVAGYLLAAARYLDGDTPLLVPALTLATALTFHLVSGWLLPSAVYLAAVSHHRRGGAGEWRASVAAAVALGAGALAYMHWHGLPIERLLSSHAGRSLRVGTYTYFGAAGESSAWDYYRDQVNLLMLLCPAVLLIGPLAIRRRLDADLHGRFLLVAASGLLVFQGVWTAQLGVYNDWNLYAVGGLVISTALWRAVAVAATTPARRGAAVAVAAVAALHTGAWILGNHFHAP